MKHIYIFLFFVLICSCRIHKIESLDQENKVMFKQEYTKKQKRKVNKIRKAVYYPSNKKNFFMYRDILVDDKKHGLYCICPMNYHTFRTYYIKTKDDIMKVKSNDRTNVYNLLKEINDISTDLKEEILIFLEKEHQKYNDDSLFEVVPF